MNYHERQVNGYSQFRGDTCRTNYGFVRLYPHLINNGAYSMWAWGFQRIIDGLELLGPEVMAFIDRFLLGRNVKTDSIRIAPMFEGKDLLTPWINF